MITDSTTQGKQAPEDRAEPTRNRATYRPPVDITEKSEELLVHADMPGADPQSIDIQFEDRSLTIHASVPERQAEGTSYLLHEYGIGDYHRVFQVSEEIDATKISAEFKDGVLILHLPKAESAKPRKIEVQVNG
jgi:HSP20 family protein